MVLKSSVAPSLISKTLKIRGELDSDGIIEIEGIVIGNIKADVITLRETAVVEGDINSRILNVKGCFKGTIQSDIINVAKKARISGTVKYKILSVEDGASINGKFERQEESVVNKPSSPKENKVK